MADLHVGSRQVARLDAVEGVASMVANVLGIAFRQFPVEGLDARLAVVLVASAAFGEDLEAVVAGGTYKGVRDV